MKALIFAATPAPQLHGGQRNPLPAAMLPVVYQPVMEILIEQLRAHGVTQILVSTNDVTRQIEQYFGDGHRFGVQIAYAYEKAATTGSAAILRGINQHSGFFDSTFLALNASTLIDLDFSTLITFHRQKKALVTMALKKMPRHTLPEYGVVLQNSDRRINRFQEKPRPGEEISLLANSGVYVFEPEVLHWIPDGNYDIGAQLLPALAQSHTPIYGLEMPFRWLDMTRMEDYHFAVMQAMLGLAAPYTLPGRQIRPGVFIGPNVRGNFERIHCNGKIYIGGSSSIGDDCRLHGPLAIGANAVIEAGCRLDHSVIMERTRIGAGSHFQSAVVGNGFAIGADGRQLDSGPSGTSSPPQPQMAAPEQLLYPHARATLQQEQL